MNALQKSLGFVLAAILPVNQAVGPTAVRGAAPAPPARVMTQATTPVDGPVITVNETVPKVDGPKAALEFSAKPTVQEFFQARLFEEPLVPTGGTPTAAENTALAAALLDYAKRTGPDDFSSLSGFLGKAPNSPWRAALLVNLGLEAYRTAHYSMSLDAWAEAWRLAKDATATPARGIADRAAGELAGLYARLGRMTELEALLGAVEGRVFTGPGSEKISQARAGLWSMQNEPGVCFRCGPLALLRIQTAQNPASARTDLVKASVSPGTGFALPQVAALSREMGMPMSMAFRAPGAAVAVPSVVHWKVGHYAAIVRQEGGRYLIQDPTFRNDVWATAAALDAEASGYFLVPESAPRAPGWRAVENEEGAKVFGKGNVNGPDPHGGGGKPKPQPCSGGAGMPVPSVDLLFVSLSLEDTPIAYAPPVGPAMPFAVHYNQREAAQPANFSYSNLGPKWTFDWISYVQDDPTNPSADVTYYRTGGFTRLFTGFSAATQSYALQPYDQTRLVRTSATSYELRWNDGSRAVFSQSDGSAGSARKIFLKQYFDPAGDAITFTYDASLRLVAIADALGQVTTLAYTQSGDPYKITRVTDPFGRFASFEYDASGRLSKITDALGLASQFLYEGASDFIRALVTPYGATTFTRAESGATRALEVLYPDGNRERTEFNGASTPGVPTSDPAATLPTGVSINNSFLSSRNTYYWSQVACAQAYGDYTKARIYHWLHTPDLSSAARVLESVKEPLENRVWSDYDGQPDIFRVGPTGQPRRVGRVLDDGSTQLFTYEYNDFGQKTKETDPLGRTFSYVYDANGIDLLETRMTRNGASELLQRTTYNSRHRPLRTTDASGQTTLYAYNARGQVLTKTNAKGETTAYGYDAKGYLTSVNGPLPGAQDQETFTYDPVGRVRTRTSGSGYKLTFDHDNLDHLTGITYPDGTSQVYGYDRLDLAMLLDRAGRATIREFNSVRQLTKETDPLGRVSRFDWCKCGQLSALTDPMGRTTKWHHDVQARRTAKEYPDGSRVRYFYEKTTSRLQRQVDEKDQETAYTYGRDDTLAEVAYANAAVATPGVSLTYDPDYPRVVSMADGTGTTLYRYAPVTDPPAPGAGQLASVDGPLPDDTITYGYDALGRRTTTAIGGVATAVGFDAGGRKIRENGPLGNIVSNYDGGTTRLASRTFPNGLTAAYQYGTLAQDEALQKITHGVGATPVSEHAYTRDIPKRRIAAWTQQAGALPAATHAFAYDDADQLTADAVNTGGAASGSYAYAYDPAGNRLSETVDGSATAFTYNALNELATRQPDPLPAATYAWDAANRLVAASTGNQTTQFTYDGLDRRVAIRQLVNGAETSLRRFVWDGDQIREERDAAGAVTKRYFDDGVRVESGASAGNYFYTRDHLGSVRELVDASGTVRARYAYDPFGRATRTAGDLTADFGFAGMLWSSEAALNLTYFRAYDPGLARWLSRDPLRDAEASEGPNLYAYVRNNSVNLIDPLGLCCEPERAAVEAAKRALEDFNEFISNQSRKLSDLTSFGCGLSYYFCSLFTGFSNGAAIRDAATQRELEDNIVRAETLLQACLAQGCGKKPNACR